MFEFRFYLVAKGSSKVASYNHAYSLANLLRVVKLPACVQLIIGPKPKHFNGSNYLADLKNEDNSTTFSAVLRLEEFKVRRTEFLTTKLI